MTEIPSEFPLPEDVAERQRSILGAHIEAGPHSSRTTRRRVVAVAGVILLGGLLVTPALGIGSRLLDLIQSTPGPPAVQTPVWSPDGRRIAFLNRHNGSKELSIVNADGSGQRKLTRYARSFATPAWSPDGRKIAFESLRNGDGGISVVNADGSGERRLAGNATAPTWSPDGQKLAFFSGSTIHVIDADGSEHTLMRLPAAGRRALAWSPDGRKLAFLQDGSCGQFCFNLYVVNSDGSGLRNLTAKLGIPRGVGAGVGAGPASDPAWSPDGRKIAFVRLNAGLDRSPVYLVKADGSGLHNLTPKPVGAYADPAWSPDGRKLAFVGERDGNAEVYVMNANGSGQRNLTRNPAFDSDPAWSPDGRKILFVSNREGKYGVHIMNADGSGHRRLAQSGP
jgi:Tol biopolymer transport system component